MAYIGPPQLLFTACKAPLYSQASSTDQIVSTGSSGGNKQNGSNGNGGQSHVVIGDLSAVQSSVGAAYNANGSNGNGSNGSRNGAAAVDTAGRVEVLASVDAAEGVEGFLEPELAGHLETAAQVGRQIVCVDSGACVCVRVLPAGWTPLSSVQCLFAVPFCILPTCSACLYLSCQHTSIVPCLHLSCQHAA